jgi:hypothetical protein
LKSKKKGKKKRTQKIFFPHYQKKRGGRMSITTYAVNLITTTTQGLLDRLDRTMPKLEGETRKAECYLPLQSFSDSRIVSDSFERWSRQYPDSTKFRLRNFGGGKNQRSIRGSAYTTLDKVAQAIGVDKSLLEVTHYSDVQIRYGVEWISFEKAGDDTKGRRILCLFMDEKKLTESLLQPWNDTPRVVKREEAEALECRPLQKRGDDGKWRVVLLPGFKHANANLRHWLHEAVDHKHWKYNVHRVHSDKGAYLWIRDGTPFREELPLPAEILDELDRETELSRGELYEI